MFAAKKSNPKVRRGLLICFIGIDGSGKTTLAKYLEKSLKESNTRCKYLWCGWRGFESFLFKPIVKIVKSFYKGKYTSEESTKFSSFNYFALFDYILRVFPNIEASLYRYDFVIADRYVYDVIVGFSTSTDEERRTEKLFRHLIRLFPVPDITFFVKVPEEVAYSRKNDIPSVDYLYRRKKMYLKLLKEYDIRVIEGTKSKDELLEIILKEVLK